MFIDEVEIRVISGNGGDGVVHFLREKFKPRGGPDGGDGGHGGDVIFKVDTNLNTLSTFRHQPLFKAPSGSNGRKQNMTGKSGADLLIIVPPGTLVYEASSGELIGDLTDPDQQLIAAKGGRGGRGNARFATSRHQAPRQAEKGEPGQERVLKLELKLIADIGIIGVPNAGKSTFLSVVTNAKPKIASYPFTTLEPNLGVVEFDYETSFVLADIPGLIEGAHQGIGLGHNFLRHIQRTRVLIHILDGLSEDPYLDFAQINSELALFDPGLSNKPQIVVFNKMDIPEVKEKWPGIKNQFSKRDQVVAADLIPISAVTGDSVRRVLNRAVEKLVNLQPIDDFDEMPVYRVESDPKQFEIIQISAGWKVKGEAIERAAAMTYWELDASIRRFQKILQALGIDGALRDAGVKEGDIVFIGDHELEWSD